MLGATYKTKKELKQNIGKRLLYQETSMFGPEYKDNGTLVVVGPDAFTKRVWYAEVTIENGLIKGVK